MPVASKSIISLSKVSYVIDGKNILSNITVDVNRGEYLGIIGPNGGGKTTMLRLMLGLETPTKGSVKVSIAKSKIGYVPQRSMMTGDVTFPATVYEVIASGIIENVSRTDRDQRIITAMKTTGVSSLTDRRIGVLSGGERQRVMIARALAGEPEVLFLDEPTAAIDPASQEDFYGFLRRLHDERKLTIVMVSHDTDAIAHEVQRVLCLNRHLICHGHPDDILHGANIEHYGH
ncbi:MAG: metal ABC transporter ATP-binding protein [Patescibacteria group bacterium]